jgi:L-asparaginase II
VAVGIAAGAEGPEGIASPGCGLGMSTKTIKGGLVVAVAALLVAQLERISAHKIRVRNLCFR